MTTIVRDIINSVHGEGDTSHSADSDMNAVLHQLEQMHGQPIELLAVEQARAQPSPADAVRALLLARGEEPSPAAWVPAVSSLDCSIPGAEGPLPARIYTPRGAGPFPLVLYFHGGGWVIADKDTYDAGARGLCDAANAIVVSVDYRRAPEAPFPAAWQDALAAYEWAAGYAATINGDPRRLALAGESAGGTLAIATAIAARDRGLIQPRAILAVYPLAQTGNMGTESYDDSAEAKPLNKAMIGWFLDKLVSKPRDMMDPRLDLINARLEGLPPVTIISAEIDPLRSDAEMLETALKEAGVEVTRKLYHGVAHEFFGMAAVVERAREAQEFAGNRLHEAFSKSVRELAARERHRGVLPRSFAADDNRGLKKVQAVGYAAKHSFGALRRFEFERTEADTDEIEVDVMYCGVCHSDIHQARNEWSNTIYPCMPGHEIVGRVTRIGSSVTRHAVGDIVGVGCMIDSCRHCEPCLAGEENYCEGPNSFLSTYNGPMIPAQKASNRANMYRQDNTFGGYSNLFIVNEDFALKIPAGLRPEVAAPILCAGATTYSPLKHWGVKPGDKVGIVGFGGLGHLAIQIARAMGADVTVFTSTEEKLDAAGPLGARAVFEKDAAALDSLKGSFDFILSTIPEKHDINPYIEMLKRDRTICVVGALETMAGVDNQRLAFHRKNVAASLIGNLADTQEVLDFCADHDIGPEIEMIRIDQVNEAYKKVERGEVRFRYVIDMASLAGDPTEDSQELEAGREDAELLAGGQPIV